MAEVGEIIKNISDDVKTIVKGEIELAKAELVPSGKNAGVGAGMFGGAGYFVLNALSLLFIAAGLGIATIFGNVLGWAWTPAIALGFVIMAVLLFVLAGILALIGRGRLKRIKGPERTVAEGKATADAVKGAVDRGRGDVASGLALEHKLDQGNQLTR